MFKELQEFRIKNSILKIIIGEKKLNNDNKNTLLFLLPVLIIFIIIILLVIYLEFENYMLTMVTTFIFSLYFFIYNYIHNNSRIKYIKNKRKIAKYKPNIFLKINLTAISGIDWDNAILKQYWFDELYEKFKNTPAEKIQYFLSVIEYEIKDKPKINYSNLIGSTSLVISIIFPLLMFIIQGLIPKEDESQKLDNLNIILSIIYGILVLFFMIVGLILIYMRQNHRDRIDRYKDSIRWHQAFQYILHKRKIEEKLVEDQKSPLSKLACNILERIIK